MAVESLEQTTGTDPKRIVGVVLMCVCFVLLSLIVVASIFFSTSIHPAVTLVAIVGIVVLAIVALRVSGDSDYVKARQSDQTLHLASETVTFMRQGLSEESAQAVCELLLPVGSANAVAITDREIVLGFAGADKENHQPNTEIQTQVTHDTLNDGKTRLVDTAQALGFKHDTGKLQAAIIVPLVVNRHIIGTLKFYYASNRLIDETQLALAEGFAQLLSTQLSLGFLEQQTELAARMELKALQAQINPHFLFNTINTIASYTRTDPEKAREMLREFAVYYRRLLENSDDMIELAAEIEQTERYLMFQRARFGEESITMEVEDNDRLDATHVPAFIVQPIVENAVNHGKREEGPLDIRIKVYESGDDLVVSVHDDGVGIKPELIDTVVESGSDAGMGLALKNVQARLKGYFGEESGLQIESEYGKGTTVFLTMHDALLEAV